MTDIRSISDLTPDAKNANQGTERGRYMLEQSLREAGAGRSIVVDRDGIVLAGNKTLEAAEELGLPIVVVKTDGSELVVVQRSDLDLTDERARKLAYYDNRTSEVGLSWSASQIVQDLEVGLDLGDMFRDEELNAIVEQAADEMLGESAADALEDGNYSREIKAPDYKPTGEKPAIADLFDGTRTRELVAEIDADSTISESEKAFLRIAAQRHTVLHFHRIADYYAHSGAETQELMENSALVIIDFNKAISLGFVKMTQKIAELVRDEYGDDD